MDIHQITYSSEAKADKKPYQNPELRVFGNISEITRTVDNKGNADGPAGGSMDKT